MIGIPLIRLGDYLKKYMLCNRVRVPKVELQRSYAPLAVEYALKTLRRQMGDALIDGRHIKEVNIGDPDFVEYSADVVMFSRKEFNEFMTAIFGPTWAQSEIPVREEKE